MRGPAAQQFCTGESGRASIFMCISPGILSFVACSTMSVLPYYILVRTIALVSSTIV